MYCRAQGDAPTLVNCDVPKCTARTAVEPRRAWMLLAESHRTQQSRRARPGATSPVVGPRHAWMHFADTHRTRQSRRAWPGATSTAVEPRHAWMLFADTHRTRPSRRAWPGATSTAVEPRHAWMLFAHANREEPPGTARRYRNAYQDRSRAQNNQAAFRRPDAHSRSHDQKKIAYRINSGIGTPNSQSRIIFMAGLLAWNAGYRSRRRPPQVALRLAKNAPISRVMNSHSAA